MSNELSLIAGQSVTGVVDEVKLGIQAFELNEVGSASPTTGSSSNDLNEEYPRQLNGWKWATAYGSTLSTTFLFALANTNVADIQPAILDDFGQVELLPWIGVGFALGTITILPWGKAYGVFNIKWIYVSNVLRFGTGSAICGASPNMTVLIIARVVAGIGGCGMHSGCLTYIAVSTTMKERPMYMSGIAVLWGLGSVLGPVVGGAFATGSATWRWAFYIILAIGAVFAPAYLLLFPSINTQPGKALKDRYKMIDWIATIIFLAGAACFTLAVSFGATTFEWTAGTEIALWSMTGVLLVVTVLLTIFHPGVTKENRLYPAHSLRRPILVNLQLQVFLVFGIMLTMTYYIPLFFQFLRGEGPLEAGVRLLPFILFMVLFSMLNGALMPKFGYATPWYFFGSAMIFIGPALMYTVNVNTPTSNLYGHTILVGAGSGCYLVAGFAIVQSLVPVKDIANAVGATTISQDLGMTVFLAISGTLYQNLSLHNVTPVLPNTSPAEIANLIAGTSSQTYKGLSQQAKDLVITQITDAMRNLWLFFLVGARLNFVLAVFLGRTRLTLAGSSLGERFRMKFPDHAAINSAQFTSILRFEDFEHIMVQTVSYALMLAIRMTAGSPFCVWLRTFRQDVSKIEDFFTTPLEPGKVPK